MAGSRASQPTVVRTRCELDGVLALARGAERRVGLVPTMGALHAGHAALLREARADADLVVTSIFVNPLQFAPGEDLHRYPRTWDADLETCAREGVDVVLAPDVADIYPDGPDGGVSVDPGPLGAVLEGAARPGHFRGVLTVVAALVGLVRPATAWFGAKDYQQLVLVRRMVRQLSQRVDVRGVPIVREPDGLALSSRNGYLDADQRRDATALWRALQAGSGRASAGPAEVESAARAVLDGVSGLWPDYVSVVAPDLAKPPDSGPSRLLVAARIGETRLIDNAAVDLGLSAGGG